MKLRMSDASVSSGAVPAGNTGLAFAIVGVVGSMVTVCPQRTAAYPVGYSSEAGSTPVPPAALLA